MDDERIPVLLCIDVEPDVSMFTPDDPSPWRGVETLPREIPQLRERLGAITGQPARFSWFLRMDPQIEMSYGTPTWFVDCLGSFFNEARALADVTGIHPHAYRWQTAKKAWLTDDGDASWVAHCVQVSSQAYRSAFGEAPKFHRFGAGFMDTPLMNELRRQGITADLTLEPGQPAGEHVGTAEDLDFDAVPRSIYVPTEWDFRQPVPTPDGPFWAIPLSSGTYVRREVGTLSRLLHPARSVRGLRRRLHTPRTNTRPSGTGKVSHTLLRMYHDWRSPLDFWNSAFELAAGLERPYLAFAVRTDAFIDPVLRRRFYDIIDFLQEDPRASRLAFVTPDELLGRIHAGQESS